MMQLARRLRQILVCLVLGATAMFGGWISRDSLNVAVRVLDAAETTILSLRFMPGRGSLKKVRSKRFKNIRTVAVKGFPNHLVVYEVQDSEVLVVAVMHGARRLSRLLRDREDEV